MPNVILTITGPSASGKSTLEKLLTGHPGSAFKRVISTTTRAPRAGELESNAYYFVTDEEFDAIQASGDFMEAVSFGKARYGATKQEFQGAFDEGRVPVVVCEPIGQAQIENKARAEGWKVVSVYLTNPLQVRYERMVERFLQDISASEFNTDFDVKRHIQTLATRLTTVATVELGWDKIGRDFTINISKFDEDNRLEVADSIFFYVMGQIDGSAEETGGDLERFGS